jgi:hypothetical protein
MGYNVHDLLRKVINLEYNKTKKCENSIFSDDL